MIAALQPGGFKRKRHVMGPYLQDNMWTIARWLQKDPHEASNVN